jgi:hypothetical protein
MQRCTSPGHHVARKPEFCVVASNMCGCSECHHFGAWNYEVACGFLDKFVDPRCNVDSWTVRPVFLTRLVEFPSTRRPAFDPDTALVRLVMEIAPGQIFSDKGKGKGHPKTGHECPKVEQRYSSALSLTSALDRGGWSTPSSGRFTPGKDTVPIL